MPYHVYRIVADEDGRTIYIGVTGDLSTRLSGHQTSGPVRAWMDEVANRDCTLVVDETFVDREAAAAHERFLIATIPALLNLVVASPGRPRLEDVDKTITAQKPWLALKMSRASWYRRQKEQR